MTDVNFLYEEICKRFHMATKKEKKEDEPEDDDCKIDENYFQTFYSTSIYDMDSL